MYDFVYGGGKIRI